MLEFVCANCGFVFVAAKQLNACISCSSAKITASNTSATQESIELQLLEHLNHRFSKRYSCLRQLAGENGFNVSTLLTKISDPSVFASTMQSGSLEEVLRLLGKSDDIFRQPTVCCEHNEEPRE